MTESIRSWLEKLGLDLYAGDFEENDLDLDLAADLTDADLKDLGVASMGHRKKLLRAPSRPWRRHPRRSSRRPAQWNLLSNHRRLPLARPNAAS